MEGQHRHSGFSDNIVIPNVSLSNQNELNIGEFRTFHSQQNTRDISSDYIGRTDAFQTPKQQGNGNTDAMSPTSRMYQSLRSPLQRNPFGDEETQISDERWVTVYGFPPEKTSFILSQFSHYGDILKHKVGNGNWIHIMYNTKFEAQKALAKNAKVFDSTLMVGVVECLDENTLRSSENLSSRITHPIIGNQDRRHRSRDSGSIYSGNEMSDEQKTQPNPQKSWTNWFDNIFRF